MPHLPVTQSSETSGTESVVSEVVMVTWLHGGAVGGLRWRMDMEMDVDGDEDNVFSLSSSTSAWDPSSRSALSAQRSPRSGAEAGDTKLLRAALLEQGVEEVGGG